MRKAEPMRASRLPFADSRSHAAVTSELPLLGTRDCGSGEIDASRRNWPFLLSFLTSAAIHLGIAPRPAHVSDGSFGLRYLEGSLRPFIAPTRFPRLLLWKSSRLQRAAA
jgi:hypothetical protein